MEEQYVEVVQKWKKAYLMMKNKIATWLYCSMAECKYVSSVQRTEAEEIEEWVFVTEMWHPINKPKEDNYSFSPFTCNVWMKTTVMIYQ